MNQITMPQKTKISLSDLSNEILAMMKDYFVAKFMQNGTNLTIEFAMLATRVDFIYCA